VIRSAKIKRSGFLHCTAKNNFRTLDFTERNYEQKSTDALSVQADVLKYLKARHEGFQVGPWKQKLEDHGIITPDNIFVSYEGDTPEAELEMTCIFSGNHFIPYDYGVSPLGIQFQQSV